ncbi:MAG: penicillin-binding protein [Candidatus Gracilibacteria bacterium]|nr:penicillin-binding protein [Candidatus Gracilibacteria bacterium]
MKKRKISSKYIPKSKKVIKKKNKGKTVLKVLMYLFIFFIISGLISSLILYKKYLVDLPSVQEMEKLEFAESSTIYDKNGIELYKIFKEKRTYVGYEQINSNMINALVAGEDKRFWENPGVDFIGLTRAGLNYVLGKSDGKVQGTSTLTQQLIRNTIIKNERSVERKIKEIYLAMQLTNGVSKEKILELYLNKISFGSNAFGIEQASKTFFNKTAYELGILESSILASIPKGPTYYSPYNHPKRLLGYPYIFSEDDVNTQIDIITQKDREVNHIMIDELVDFISNITARPLLQSNKILLCNLDQSKFKISQKIDNSGECVTYEYSELLNMLNAIQIKKDGNIIEYQTGRKDFILGRMLEDGYITFDEYKTALLDSFGYTFMRAREDIKAPHFVFYVKEYLEEKYGSDLVSKGGLKIYTTLDYELQKKAQDIIDKQVEVNTTKFNAKNAAVISIDNKDGTIVTMVGSKDYFDETNKGNVNVITSRLQPGSTFKPFVYSIASYKEEIGSKTPVYDLETEFPSGYSPQNFDGKFQGKMNFSTALNNSRNIPAIKMFFLAGGEKTIVDFMKSIGVNSLRNHGQYGAPLALGTGEMTPLELATAYGVFANMGKKKELTPILKIEDARGNIIHQHVDSEGEQVISSGQTYIMNTVLSDTSTRPVYWNKTLDLNGRAVASKTGTSNKKINDVIYPVNLWTAGYTPQYTTVAWAGNTDGENLSVRGNGLDGASGIFHDFMVELHKGSVAENWKKPAVVKDINISDISGFLPSPENNQNNFLTKSLFLNKPTQYDSSFKTIEIDALCGGIISENTPDIAKEKVTLVEFHSLSPYKNTWEIPVQKWAQSEKAKEMYGNISNLVTSVNETPCERSAEVSHIQIGSEIKNGDFFVKGINTIRLAYRSTHPMIRLDVLLDGKQVDTIDIDNKKEGIYQGNILIPSSYTDNQDATITLRGVDNQYFSYTEDKQIYIIGKDIIKPKITITNPSDKTITLYNNNYFNLRGYITDRSPIRTINIYINDETYKIGVEGPKFAVPIYAKNLGLGQHIIRIEAIDYAFNKSSELVQVDILEE